MDSVLDYGDKGHPDFFFLCCRTASAEGGGASYLIDLEECLTQIEPWARVALEGLKIVQKIELPPNYGSYSLPAGSDSNAQTMDAADANTAQAEPEAASEAAWEPGSRAGKRVEQLFTRTAAGRKLLRVSSFSDAAALLEDMEAEIINLRPVPSSTSPDRDMAVVRQWLHAVATAEENAPRVVLKEVSPSRAMATRGTAQLTFRFAFAVAQGEAILVDNYRCAHGRDGYSDLSRAMWQIWVWSDRCVVDSMPQDPGVGREWLPLHSKSMGTQPGPSPHMAPKL
eukprot:SAG31_NODE_444_length_15625_cov_6.047469_12_plen_283_part_00